MISSLEDCKDGCLIMEGRCVDDCDKVMSRGECRGLEDCTWLFLEYTGDKGRCGWKKDENYSCFDVKRYSECKNGGDINILYNKCEYYEGRCREKCSLYIDEERCTNDESGDCVWLTEETGYDNGGRCIIKVCYITLQYYTSISYISFPFLSLCFLTLLYFIY
jgi:hypothetical protein